MVQMTFQRIFLKILKIDVRLLKAELEIQWLGNSSVVKCLCRIPAVGSILSLVLPNVLENDFFK